MLKEAYQRYLDTEDKTYMVAGRKFTMWAFTIAALTDSVFARKCGIEKIQKFNGGRGATLCNNCSVIISEGVQNEELFCDTCKNTAEKYMTAGGETDDPKTHAKILFDAFALVSEDPLAATTLSVQQTIIALESHWWQNRHLIMFYEQVLVELNQLQDA